MTSGKQYGNGLVEGTTPAPQRWVEAWAPGIGSNEAVCLPVLGPPASP
ncbi:hypothetical protein [Burkholderia glumae]|nr:hypothetical protein [Burkholderia glumae]MCQ0034722.1 hypothetical protein [Burkholderia glumae]MCQ0040444.1 hypothetical protein [Burkholderia glumae]QHE13251.1 hypothetical protein GQR88_23635 [Burkholderia glumae AU6208]QJW82085.1 hypothetical protein GAS18_26420 [Burkholderia glumae]